MRAVPVIIALALAGGSAAWAADPPASVPLLPATAQPLGVAIPWTWPPVGSNQIPLEQFAFADTQPESCAKGAGYVTGGSSFSNAYRAFIEALDPGKFTPPSVLDSARRAAAPPSVSPAAGGYFPGWIAVPNSGGLLEYRPEYAVAMTPQEWQAAFGRAFRAASKSARRAALSTAGATGAALVVRIPVTPGAWYNDAVVQLGAEGPFLQGMSTSRLVGDGGVLRCRITELFVAAGLTSGTAAPTAVRDAGERLNVTTTVVQPLPPDRIGLTLAYTPGVPYIIGVSVQPVLLQAAGRTGVVGWMPPADH